MDPIAEMFIQIQNARSVGKPMLEVSFSKTKMAILEILKEAAKILNFSVREEKNFKKIIIELVPAALPGGFIKRVSRPGRRVYASFGNLPRPKSPKGLVIVSTSQGMMTGEEARKKGLGGEIIGEVI